MLNDRCYGKNKAGKEHDEFQEGASEMEGGDKVSHTDI